MVCAHDDPSLLLTEMIEVQSIMRSRARIINEGLTKGIPRKIIDTPFLKFHIAPHASSVLL